MINYFDTPEYRRQHGDFMPNLMGRVVQEYEKRIEQIKKSIPNKFTNIKEIQNETRTN